MIKCTLVVAESGDWEAMYIDGKLYAENHSLRSFDVLGALLAFHIDMEIERRYIADEIAESGMPEDLKDVP